MAYVAYSPKRPESQARRQGWNLSALIGRLAVAGSLLFVTLAIFGL